MFLPTVFVDVDRRYPRRWPTLALTRSLSLSLRVTVFFPFHIKTYLPQFSSIIEIQDSIVFGCSHFIKVALIRNLALIRKYLLSFCRTLHDSSMRRGHANLARIVPILVYVLRKQYNSIYISQFMSQIPQKLPPTVLSCHEYGKPVIF